ncbi:MAG: glycoside hydrolase, partial [Thermoleophilia bacterium]|nr:glycoside hydrolase [Thermoleophilia bacterium]
MSTSEPLHVAFVWHMHQPYYRSARTGAFDMPWARLHALKDYLDMVEMLADYPDLHHTFNLVPSLVEQLEDYAGGQFFDVYWEHTLKPADQLDPAARAFIVERMCERSDHPRARTHARYGELASKREAHAHHGWEACAGAFTDDELRDLQIWFDLAWFDPRALESGPLSELVAKGRHFSEDDKQVIAHAQADILARTLPAYRDAARRGQVELSTSPYFHPILPLLANTDSARIGAPQTLLPPRRFAHPEDAAEHVRTALAKHELVFGDRPRGMWCSEQAVGEDMLPLLMDAGLSWTISDETVLARSLAGAAGLGSRALTPHSLYTPFRLEREGSEIAMVFR